MDNFASTRMGQKFYNVDVPKIAKGIDELTKELSVANKLKERELNLKEKELKLKEEELKKFEVKTS